MLVVLKNYTLMFVAVYCLLIPVQADFLKDKEFVITINRNMTCKDNSTIGTMYVNGIEVGRTLELP